MVSTLRENDSLDIDRIKAHALGLGFEATGVALPDNMLAVEFLKNWLAHGFHAEMSYMERNLSIRENISLLLPSAKTVLVFRINYNQSRSCNSGEAKIARYAFGRDYHKVIRKKLKMLESWMKSVDPVIETRICVDSAPVLERHYGQKAGLGWFGKNTCLIDSKSGSWFFIATMLTNLDLPLDMPAIGSCGTCSKCVDSCPTGAIVQLADRWAVDSRKCISYLTIEKRGEFSEKESEMIGDWTFGCDICQEVCPFNQPRESQPGRAKFSKIEEFRRRLPVKTLNEIALMNRDQFDEFSQGSALRRTGFDGLKRNAAANLKNQKILS